jgi:hypothetical protein
VRTLKFVVEGQNIRPDPSCDFTGLFPGTGTDIRAEFSFSPEWKSGAKVAAFWSMMCSEYPPRELKDGKSCMIPREALKRAAFKVQILGKINGAIVPTNKLTVYQKGGKA